MPLDARSTIYVENENHPFEPFCLFSQKVAKAL